MKNAGGNHIEPILRKHVYKSGLRAGSMIAASVCVSLLDDIPLIVLPIVQWTRTWSVSAERCDYPSCYLKRHQKGNFRARDGLT